MAIQKRGAYFVLDFTDDKGKRVRRRFKTQAEAEAAAKPVSNGSDLSRVVSHYLAYAETKRPDTLKSTKYVLFSAMRGGLEGVTVEAVNAYIAKRRQAVTASTVTCDGRYLRAALRLAEADGIIAKAPKVRVPSPPQKEIFTLSEEQIRKLIDAARYAPRVPHCTALGL